MLLAGPCTHWAHHWHLIFYWWMNKWPFGNPDLVVARLGVSWKMLHKPLLGLNHWWELCSNAGCGLKASLLPIFESGGWTHKVPLCCSWGLSSGHQVCKTESWGRKEPKGMWARGNSEHEAAHRDSCHGRQKGPEGTVCLSLCLTSSLHQTGTREVLYKKDGEGASP